MNAEFSQRARNDLTDIWLYIAEDNLDAADGLRDEIKRAVGMLARHPESGRERDELLRGLRSFPVGQYLILYRVRETVLQVVRIVHGMRDLAGVLAEE